MSIGFEIPLPDAEVRDGVAEIVSFVLGRRLMRVGSTLFDESDWPIEQEAFPWGNGFSTFSPKLMIHLSQWTCCLTM